VWASRPRPIATSLAARQRTRRSVAIALGALIIVSAAGAVVALGDTLFPQASLAAGLAADFSPTSHALIRLRLWHPIAAVATSLYLFVILGRGEAMDDRTVRPAARVAIALVVIQIALGAVNVLTLAPLVVQMAHLLVSNLLWIALVWVWLQLGATATTAEVSSSPHLVAATVKDRSLRV
jgi:cytochrome c oxidase assembly protein subunit 15